MSYLLETLGRGLLGRLLNAFEDHLAIAPSDEIESLAERRRDAPTSFDLTIRLGSAYLRQTRLRDARQMFETAGQLDGPRHLAAIGLACVHDELGRTDSALAKLCEARTAIPRDPAVVFAIGLCEEQRGDSAAARAAYRAAIELCPELRNAHERLAAIAVWRGNWEGAREHYAQLAKLEPGDLDVLLPLAGLHLQNGDARAAADIFQRALLIEPDSADESLDDAAGLENEGQLVQAIETVEKLVSKYPNVTEFRVHLGDLYVKVGDDEAAITQYRAALDLHPTFLEATIKLGTQHLRRQRYDDAAQAFNRAVELNDRLLTAFVGLGVAQYAGGGGSEAQATFDLAASLAPNSTLLFSESNRLHLKALRRRDEDDLLHGDAEESSGQDDLLMEAIRRNQQILLSYPHRADLHYRHGMLLRQIGDIAGSEQAFRDATNITPSFVKAQIRLGITQRESGRPDESLEAFRRAMEVDENQIDLHYQLGILYSQYNRFELAVDRFETALVDERDGGEFRHNLALALQNIGMLDRIHATWHMICELSTDTCSPRSELPARIRGNALDR